VTDQLRFRTRPAARAAGRVAWVLTVLVVALQIPYPLLDGELRDLATIAAVVVFFAASVLHAASSRSIPFALWLVVVAGGVGFGVEVLGTRTGLPFGEYAYTGDLGPRVADVPLVIPMAWTMMAYPALIMARAITHRPLLGVLLAAWALTAWDLFLDPQMVAAGQWEWVADGAYLGIPLSNFAGWLATGLVMMALLWPAARAHVGRATLPASGARGDAVPVVLYLWTWIGSTVAHLVFLDLEASGAAGFVGMGSVVALWAWQRRSAR